MACNYPKRCAALMQADDVRSRWKAAPWVVVREHYTMTRSNSFLDVWHEHIAYVDLVSNVLPYLKR
jgi:hypothetical protein